MKRIKKIKDGFVMFIKKQRYPIALFSIILFTTWYFCLPDQLFDKPTSTVILDQDGNLLAASIADDGQWRFPQNDSVPYKFEKAIVQFEDRNFRNHLGISVKGIGRALYQNLKSGKKVSGGSTITMQIMRMSRGNRSRTIWQKIIEMFWASRAEWRFNKDELLAIYASNAPMGGNVVGLDAAAWRYFGRSANELSWAETATLAVLPNAPSLMHPGKNRVALKAKRNRLLDRLYEVGEMDSIMWELSKLEPLPSKPHPIPRIAPHLMNRAIADGLSGQVVKTTVNAGLQARINAILKHHHRQLSENEIHNAAVMVMDVKTGEVLAYNGNVLSTGAEHGKDVDIITAPRSSGSILKPFLYASNLESGAITPSMAVQDIPTVMSGYSPKNYNLKYDGIVPIDEALSRSLNVPMVRLLTQFGIEKFHYTLKKIGFTTITKSPKHYGLSLILGGAEVNLWDLVNIYAKMARCLNQYPTIEKGVNRDASYLKKDHDYEMERPIFSAATCWFTFKAMREVERPEEDINWELFNTSQEIAWKTGTSFGFRDAWAVGTNSKYVVGVWVGNADGEGRPGLIGRTAAAPILFDVFSSLPKAEWFNPPFDELEQVKICSKTGYRANSACEQINLSYVPKSSLKTKECIYHKFIHLDSTKKFQVNASCYPLSNAIKTPWFKLPAIAEYYYKNHDPNFKKPPSYFPGCIGKNDNEELAILYPKSNSTIFIPLNFEEENESIFFEATLVNSAHTLYWHLDENFIGQTNKIHQIEFKPTTGKHRLMIIDEKGNQTHVDFEVVVSNN